MTDKRFRIPDVDVKLTPEEVAITQTRTFQRLFDLKQLGLAYLVYPAASHTRGAHSIRCLFEAERILGVLDHVDQTERTNVRVAALLHDIGHVPFSHSLEDENVVLHKHDRSERLQRALDLVKRDLRPEHARLVDHATPVLLAIADEHKYAPDWRSDLVGNTVCADLLAYITTDAAETGIEKRPGYYRLYEYFEAREGRLCIRLTKAGLRNDIVSAITDLLDMRYALTERVIFHHAKCVASAMLARAARLCNLRESDDLLRMGDEPFLDLLEKQATASESTGAQNLVSGLRSRRLYKRVFKIGSVSRNAWDEGRTKGEFCRKWRHGKNIEDLLSHVEDTHDLPHGSLVLWCPEQEANMKLARAQVIWDAADGSYGPAELRSDEVGQWFPGVHNRVLTIENQYLDLWTFWIAMDSQHLNKAAGIVRTLEERIGVSCDPVFVKTYLHSLPGFKDRAGRGKVVAGALQELQPQIETQLEYQQASLGGLEGAKQLDESVILATAAAVVDKRIRRAPVKAAEGQPRLFPGQSEDLPPSDNKEK